MNVCFECCVLSGRSLCDDLINSPEKYYQLWCVGMVWSRNLVNEEALPYWGMLRQIKENHRKIKLICVIFKIQFFFQSDNTVHPLEGILHWILYKEIITIYFNNYMEGLNEDSNMDLMFQFFVIVELIVGEESRLENVITTLGSESNTEYLLSTKLRNVNILEVIICLLLCYTSSIITSHCI